MNAQTYEAHACAACTKGLPLDPMVVMSFYRTAMRSPAARKFGSNPYRRAYRDIRDRVAKRAYLPDMTPRTALEAGILALNKAQVVA